MGCGLAWLEKKWAKPVISSHWANLLFSISIISLAHRGSRTTAEGKLSGLVGPSSDLFHRNSLSRRAGQYLKAAIC